MNQQYHYTESGLDNVWLANGYDIVTRPSGQYLTISDVEGLHRALGLSLCEKRDLTGKELKFLRKELLLAQATLARIIGVSEQTVQRWETGKAELPKTAESLVKLLYREAVQDDDSDLSLRARLEELAKLENEIDGYRRLIAEKEATLPWHIALKNAA